MKWVQPCAEPSVAVMDWDLRHRRFLLCLSVFCPKPSVAEVGSAPARTVTDLGSAARDPKSKRVSTWGGGSLALVGAG